MTLDFSGIPKDLPVGYKHGLFVEGRYFQSQITFEEAVYSFALCNDTRWEAYARMKEEVKKIDEMQRGRVGDLRGLPQSFKVDAVDSFRKEVLTRSMELIADVYLSKGLINNEPLPTRR